MIRQLVNGTSAPRIPSELSALLAALQFRGAETRLLNKLTDAQWRELTSFCSRSQLTLLLARLDQKSIPFWITEQLNQNLIDNANRAGRIKATYTEAASALEAANVEHLVVKGFTQVPQYAPSLSNRSQSDIDLYCLKDQLLQAKASLESIGYVADNIVDYRHADHLPTLTRKGKWSWTGNHFDPEMPLSIELHFSLWNSTLCLIHLPEVDLFWERRQVRTIDNFKFYALDPVDQFGYFSLHILRNLLFGNWVVHHVFELANFLHNHANDDQFWKRWKEMHTARLRSLEAIAFVYAKSWFNCDLSVDVEREIATLSPAVKQWLDLYTDSSLEGMFRENKDWVFLNTALLSSREQKSVWLRRTMFPQRLPRTNSPGITYKNRKPRNTSNVVASGTLNPASPLRYCFYLMNRIPIHLFVITKALYKGSLWWLSVRMRGRSINRKYAVPARS